MDQIQCSLIPKVEGHDLSINDVVARVAVGSVDPWVFACGLGQGLLEPLVEGASHVID